MTQNTFELGDRATGRKSELPVRPGTIGPSVVDVGSVYRDHDVFTFDPGFGVTASCESKITYIDGDAGVLLYRGYPVEQLAEKSTFMECAISCCTGSSRAAGSSRSSRAASVITR